MCGRVRLSSDVSEIKLVFSISPHRPAPNFAPSWNAAPTDQLPIVRYDAKAGEGSCLVPIDNFHEWKKNATGNGPRRPFSSHLIGPDGVAALPVVAGVGFGKAVRSLIFQMPPSRT
jgi:putative SOS response-associated peptidase YedK